MLLPRYKCMCCALFSSEFSLLSACRENPINKVEQATEYETKKCREKRNTANESKQMNENEFEFIKCLAFETNEIRQRQNID